MASGDIFQNQAGVYQKIGNMLGPAGGVTGTQAVSGNISLVDNTTASPRIGRINYDGLLRVQLLATQMFYDTFDTGLDTVNKWTTPTAAGGGVAATNAVGASVLSTGTTINGYSVLQSQAAFQPTVPGKILFQSGINLEYPITLNTYRFWGMGTNPATPTAAAPLTDASGFEVATNGKLYCVQYSGGVRGVIADLSAATGTGKQVTDSAVHQYIMAFNGSEVLFSIDNIDSVVATSGPQYGPNVNTLPVKYVAVAGTTAPTTAGLLQVNAIYIADEARNNQTLSDGTYGWRKATVSPTGALATGGTNSGATVTGNLTASGTANAVSAVVTSAGNITIQVSGTYVAAFTFQGSSDGGTTWVNYC